MPYAFAWGTNLTPDGIWEEMICDSLGDMNVFSEANAREYAAKMLPEIKKVVTETAKSPTQTRGSPEGKASRQNYFSYQTLGIRVVSHTRQELQKLYADVEDGIANGIAVEYGNKVYITDSSKENGVLKFGIHKDLVYEIDDAQTRKEFIRRKNNDSISKELVSDGLLGKFGNKYDNNRSSNRQRPLGNELQADIGKSEYKQERVSEINGDQGVSRERAKHRTDDEINNLLEQLKTKLASETETNIADGYDQTDEDGRCNEALRKHSPAGQGW